MKLSTPAMLVTFLCALVTAPAALAAPNVDGVNGIDGACCLPDGDCVVVSATDCAGMSGEYRGDGTACDPDTCPTGACCLQGGACVTLTGPACALVANSTYQGDGTACAGGQCPTGACCLPDTTCVATSPADCTAQGGEYQGNGVLCATFGVCDGLPGACCLADLTCIETVDADCTAQGGTFQGEGTDCATADCPRACCFGDGSCAIETAADCTAMTGDPQAPETACDPGVCPQTGACCLADLTCVEVLEADCAGTFQGEGTDCATADCPRACCFGDGSCTIETAADCTAMAGDPQAPETACDPGVCLQTGACCLADLTCVDVLEADCAGTFQGEGTDCATADCPRACCFGDGSCEIRTEADCIANGGAAQIAGTACMPTNPCPQLGACCLGDLTCVDVLEADCAGTFQGEGTDCGTADCPRACCFGDGSCEIRTEADCIANGGAAQITGTACMPTNPCPQTGACCLGDLTCVEVLEADCTGMFQGEGSDCTSADCPRACCFGDGSCEIRTEADCIANGGAAQIAGTACMPTNPCPQLGACCLGDLTCVDVLEADCTGMFQGEGSDCGTADCPRACCFNDGSCDIQTAADCGTNGGVAQPSGTACMPTNPCPQPGACCVAGDLCTEVLETECDVLGGTFQGEMVPCSPTICPRACCLENGLCENLDSAACATVGGTDLGEGADCATRPCIAACCLGDGTCQDLDRTACSMTGGTYAGFGNDCAAAPCNGACCLDDASCQDIDGDACAAAGGMFRGLGSTCISLPCLGGCCLDTGCADPEISEGACYNAGGIFSGRGVACEFTACSGRCCVTTDTENLLCVDVMSRGECRMLGGVFEVGSCGGTGTPCDTRSEDFCDDAFEIVVGETAFANFHAEAEPDGPPTCGDSPIGADIWFDFCPEGPGLYEFSTCGSSFDTVIEVYTGADCPDFVRVACNDDFDCNNDGLPDTTSSVTVQVEDNIDYHVRIGGYLGARGSGVLTIKIVGDDCEDAVDASVMQGNEIELEFPTRGFTLDGPGACVGDRGGAGVITDTWYEYDSGDFVGTTEITATADPSVETYIAVYTDLACPVGSATRIACEGPGTPVLLPVVANERFKIQLLLNRPADEGVGAGSGTLKIVEQVESTGNECDPCLDVFERPCGDIAENTGTVDDTGPECQVGTITEDVVDAWRCFSVGPTAFGGEILVQNNALFPHTLAVFDGCPELTGELLDCEMSMAETTFVRVAIPVEGVVDYRIRLGAAPGDSGPYELSITCPFDVTGDGVVDFADILNVLSNWMAPVGPEHGDGNGVVDFADILGILTGWQFVCPTGDVLPTGACCLGTGSCEIMTAGDCECTGGAYQGDDSDCSACGQ